MKKTIFSAFLVFALVFSFGNQAQAQVSIDQTLLQKLSAQVESLRMQLGGLVSRSAVAPSTIATTQASVTTKSEASLVLPTTILRLNATGSDVTTLQKFLVEQKLLDSRYATGVYDANTVAAVRTAQSRAGAPTDGTWGPTTSAKISNSWGTSWGESGYTKSDSTTTSPSAALGGGITIQPVLPQTICLPNSAPWVKVTSPNGGETYTAGQQITVTWTSCNVQNFTGANTSAVKIALKQQSTGTRYNLISDTNPQYGYGNFTQNDGFEVVVLPTSLTYPAAPISYGTDFRVIVALTDPYPPLETNNPGVIYDESNNLFTINGNGGECDEDDINVSIDGNTPEGVQPINQFNVLRFTIMNESNCDIRLDDIDVAYMTTDMKPYFDEIQVRDVNTNAFLGENDELQEDPNFYLGEQIDIEVHNPAPLNGALLIPAGTDKELMLKLQNYQQPIFDNTVPYEAYLHKYLMFGFHDGGDFDFKWVNNNSPFTVQLENNTWGKRVRIPVTSLSI